MGYSAIRAERGSNIAHAGLKTAAQQLHLELPSRTLPLPRLGGAFLFCGIRWQTHLLGWRRKLPILLPFYHAARSNRPRS
jgi:hypothetical protein